MAREKANTSMLEVQALETRVEQVKAEYLLNQRHLEDTNNAVDQADLKAKKAANDARLLEDVSHDGCFLILDKIITLFPLVNIYHHNLISSNRNISLW